MEIPRFGRVFFASDDLASRIGGGSLGGKAEGLVRIHEALQARFGRSPVRDVDVAIPRMVVLATDAFDRFMGQDDLYAVALSDIPDERIAHAFQKVDLPTELLGDLRALVEEAHTPLAVRSSSLLEDALAHPFAGVYETKMVPNQDLDPAVRFRALVEAIKLVYASAFFRGARTYRRAIGAADRDEKMAVLIQEVVGVRHGDRFYPHISAVGRSFSYYPTGYSRPEDGVIQLALGLGKSIVDGGVCWTYSPRHPTAPPPFGSVRRMLQETQSRFWAVNMGKPPAYDPVAETEYLVEAGLQEAEQDRTLRWVASTYDAASDRLSPGTGREGPRVLDFAPLLRLREWEINEALAALLALAEESLGMPVEIEVAATLPASPEGRLRMGLVQVRAMAAPGEETPVEEADLAGPDVLLGSCHVMGNGVSDTVQDVVYTKPGTFDFSRSREVAVELDAWNRALMDDGRPYMLIGFGRWGSADPWLGVPVTWGQVAGARVIVEATRPGQRIEPSQGSHFFHNVSSLGVVYISTGATEPTDLDWELLAARDAVAETALLRHVRLERPLHVRVDGRSGRGYVRWAPPSPGDHR
ncbi:MAG TPA: PEP/pyruvate-binding domain-containing protein [Longimicrobiales bacterium]|nr:PEP/pyruvate-binding domain-containing protein [Longimicrobiales bacterium]